MAGSARVLPAGVDSSERPLSPAQRPAKCEGPRIGRWRGKSELAWGHGFLFALQLFFVGGFHLTLIR